ncbi:MAG: ribbon-helix-helix protein, CopG family [Acidobacteria bacterium]|nr:ribbon-helix-helix protein, CopG family [Acidobacteriota bacterium]
MIRTQIQLTQEQATLLKRMASASGRSMADLVREGVDQLLRDHAGLSRAERMTRAACVFGRFASGTHDLSSRHDDHFADAANQRP